MHYQYVSKGAKIRNRYNQVTHLAQDTNGKVTNSQLDTTNESQEVSPFQAADHKAHINRCVQRHNKHKTEKQKTSTKDKHKPKNIKNPQKKYRLIKVTKILNCSGSMLSLLIYTVTLIIQLHFCRIGSRTAQINFEVAVFDDISGCL